MSNHRSGLFLGGMLVGTALGTVAGLLFAPRSGRDTRQLVKQSVETLPDLADELAASLQLQADRFSSSALSHWDETLDHLRDSIAAGRTAAQEQQQQLQQEQSNPYHPST